MAYGIEIRNNGGNIVIDGEYRNYMHLFTSTPTLQFVTYDGFCSATAVYFPVTVTSTPPPMVFFRTLSGRVGTGPWIGGPGNWQGIYFVTDNSGISGNYKYAQIEYRGYVVANSGQISYPGNYGLQVFNETGTRMFDSRAKPLAIQNRATISFPSSPQNAVGSTVLSANSAQGIDVGSLGYLDGTVTSGGDLTYDIQAYKALRDTDGNVRVRHVVDFQELPDGGAMSVKDMGTNSAPSALAMLAHFR